jgi:hypothetical protein
MLLSALSKAAAWLPAWLSCTIGIAGSTVAIALSLIRGYVTVDSVNRVCSIRLYLHKIMPHPRRVSYADVACLRMEDVSQTFWLSRDVVSV